MATCTADLLVPRSHATATGQSQFTFQFASAQLSSFSLAQNMPCICFPHYPHAPNQSKAKQNKTKQKDFPFKKTSELLRFSID